MKTVISKKCVLGLMFGMVFIVAGTAQAENYYLPANEHQETLSAGTVIEHNKRLMAETSIGKAIKNSTEMEARKLYKEAEKLLKAAIAALIEGQEELAKNLAYKSIDFFYQSDKAHYRL